jgi:hypothetical protein
MSIDENRQRVDDALSFLTIKKLVTPVSKTPAYKYGIVDQEGRIIKKPTTPEEESYLTLFDKFIFKIKRLLGGKISQLNNFMYVQTLDNNFYNNLVVRGAIEQRASIIRVKHDIEKLIEKHDITIDDMFVYLIHSEVNEIEKEERNERLRH